jgi:hypothetical protein
MTLSKTTAVLRLWALALAISAGLVAAGLRWPQPLQPRGDVVALLLLGPPLVMALWLLSRWRLDPAGASGKEVDPDRGESID